MNAGKPPLYIRLYHGKTPGVKLHVSNEHYRYVPPDRMSIVAFFFRLEGTKAKRVLELNWMQFRCVLLVM